MYEKSLIFILNILLYEKDTASNFLFSSLGTYVHFLKF